MQSTPRTMRAAAIDRPGTPRAITVHQLPVPTIGPNEVLIAVDTAGVGRWDTAMREGWYPDARPTYPLVLGADGSGIVAAIGSRVRRLKRGDRVYAYNFASAKGGFYAEYVAVPAANVGRPPRSLDLRHAGAAAVVALTALQGIDDSLRVSRGEAVVVHGAAGGVGSFAVQFAKLRGARVLATATRRDGLAFVRRLGADAVLDGRRDDLAEAIRVFAPDGVDKVLALAGQDLPRCLDALRRGGRVAYPNGIEPTPRKRRGITLTAYDAEPGVREFARLGRALAAAHVTVPIAASYPLARAADAHRRLERGHVLGKIVLRIDSK